MQPDKRLDALLSERQRDGESNRLSGTTPLAPAAPADQQANGETAEIDSLLGVADRFAVWGGAEPPPVFADRLEAQLLARFATQPQDRVLHGLALTPPRSSAGQIAEQAPGAIRGAIGEAAEETMVQGSAAPIALHPRSPGVSVQRRPSGRFPVRHVSRPPWKAIAAALLIVGIGTGTLAVAASNAAPGQPLYALLRVVQGVRSQLATSPAERVRLHLQDAQDALAAFDAAVASTSGEQAYRDALATFADEERAASAELANVPSGAERDALATQLGELRERGRHDLHTALPSPVLSWSIRAGVTQVLGQMGDSVPAVARASITGASQHGTYTWSITVEGSGFTPGAVVLIDGRPTGTIVSRSATTMVAQVVGNALRDGAHSVGVGNLDGTAALVANVTTNRLGDDHGGDGGGHGGDGGGGSGQGTPTPQGTSGGDDHGGSGGGGGGGSGGSGGSATPTPTPTATPDDHH